MKHTTEEKNQTRFFRSINLLTERFFSDKEVNLDQLEQFAKTGNMNVSLNIVTAESPYKIMKECELKKQDVLILKLQTEIRDYKLYALLQEKFAEITFFNGDKNGFFGKFVEKNILADGEIYQKLKTGLKKETFPKIYGYGIYSNIPDPYFMEYVMPALYQKNHPPTIKIFYNRGGARKLRGIPTQLREGTIIVVGKKKQNNISPN